MNIATLQIPFLPISESKLDYYLRICNAKDVDVLVFGEYVLNLFFKELASTPKNMIKEQSKRQIESLKKFAQEYNIVLVAPVITNIKDKLYKSIARAMPDGKIFYYKQQVLMPYKHWNERAFFANDSKRVNANTFTYRNVKFGIMFGYEMHFDEFWISMKKKDVDCVLMPTVSTFESKERWRNVLKTRSFLNSMYILRANRIGEWHDEAHVWKFYGDSLFILPNGEIESELGDKEELLVGSIDAHSTKNIRKEWGFYT